MIHVILMGFDSVRTGLNDVYCYIAAVIRNPLIVCEQIVEHESVLKYTPGGLSCQYGWL